MSSVRFVDANVFVHSLLKPKRTLTPVESRLKKSAKSIVSRINEGESVLMTVVHLSEMSNIFEEHMPLHDAQSIERSICLKENIKMAGVSREDYLLALDKAREKLLGLNDALAYTIMKREGVEELYSFDQDFDRLSDITRVTV